MVLVTPEVAKLTPRGNATLLLSFDGGERRLFDVGPHLSKGIFTELPDPNYLGQVKPFFGGVGWPHGQDFSADTLYLESQPVSEAVL